MLKGTRAVILAGYFAGPDGAMLAGLGAFLGHLFPVWLKFRAARASQPISASARPVLAGGAVVRRGVARDAVITRDSSLSALIASVAPPISCGGWATGARRAVAPLTLLIFYAHRKTSAGSGGTEGKIGQKA